MITYRIEETIDRPLDEVGGEIPPGEAAELGKLKALLEGKA